MENFLNNILPNIMTLVLSIAGSNLLYFGIEKRKKKNEANRGEMENYSYIIKTLRDNMDSMDRRIDALSDTNEKYFNEIQKQRDDKILLREEITVLKVEKERLNSMKCEVIGCTNRRPPSEAMK